MGNASSLDVGHVERKVREAGRHVENKAREAGRHVDRKAREAGRHVENKAREAGRHVDRKRREAGRHLENKVREADNSRQFALQALRSQGERALSDSRVIHVVDHMDIDFLLEIERINALRCIEKKAAEAASHVERKVREAGRHVDRKRIEGGCHVAKKAGEGASHVERKVREAGRHLDRQRLSLQRDLENTVKQTIAHPEVLLPKFEVLDLALEKFSHELGPTVGELYDMAHAAVTRLDVPNIDEFADVMDRFGNDIANTLKKAGKDISSAWNRLSPEMKTIIVVIAVAATVYYAAPALGLNAKIGVALQHGGSEVFINVLSTKEGASAIAALGAGLAQDRENRADQRNQPGQNGREGRGDSDINVTIRPPSDNGNPQRTSQPQGDAAQPKPRRKRKKTKSTHSASQGNTRTQSCEREKHRDKMSKIERKLQRVERHLQELKAQYDVAQAAVNERHIHTTINYGVNMLLGLKSTLALIGHVLDSETCGQDEITPAIHMRNISHNLQEMIGAHPDVFGDVSEYAEIAALANDNHAVDDNFSAIKQAGEVTYKATTAVAGLMSDIRAVVVSQAQSKLQLIYDIMNVELAERQRLADQAKQIDCLNQNFDKVVEMYQRARRAKANLESRQTGSGSSVDKSMRCYSNRAAMMMLFGLPEEGRSHRVSRVESTQRQRAEQRAARHGNHHARSTRPR